MAVQSTPYWRFSGVLVIRDVYINPKVSVNLTEEMGNEYLFHFLFLSLYNSEIKNRRGVRVREMAIV